MKAAGFSEMLIFTRLYTTTWMVCCVHRLDYGLDDLGFESRQDQLVFFFVLKNVPTGSGAHPASGLVANDALCRE